MLALGQEMTSTILLLSLAGISISSWYLMICHHYQDGLFERVALASISFSSAVGLIKVLTGDASYDPAFTVTSMGVAMFMMRYAVCVFKSRSGDSMCPMGSLIK